ncbi:MAG: DNA gyrase subunit B [Patescibacteria group bacterium]
MIKKQPEKKDKSSYSAQDITVLKGLDPVRKRPGMYIGTTGPDGLHHLITEIWDNSRDEAMGGFANDIEVALLPGNRVRVTDNGRGIPVDVHKETKVSALETIMTTLHAGGKFGGEGYKVSGGLHGVGASVVNALSIFTRVVVHRDGGKFIQEYKQGKKQENVKKIGKSDRRGTITTFEPDKEIFPDVRFDFDKVVSHLRQQAYLVKSTRVTVIDARDYEGKIEDLEAFYLRELELELKSHSFYFEGGLRSMVTFLNHQFKIIHKNIFYVEKFSNEHESVEIALQYTDDISSRILPFANNIFNSEGGTHLTGFKTALTRTLNTYAKNNNLQKGDEDNFTGDDVLEGLTVVLSVKLREIQFEGQTKSKLGTVEARSMVETVFSEAFAYFLEEHPDDARSIISKAILALRARKAAKAAKDSVLRKGALEGMTLPGKLSDCQSGTPAEEAELFIVEGDSAGGTAKQGRDRRTQAILPLKGKPLNVERARIDKILGHAEIKAIVIAIGTAIGETFDLTKLRYHKLIIATDADVDGAHIRTLLLTLFYRHFKVLVEKGFVYIAQPPLYKIKRGKEMAYAYSDLEKENVLAGWKVSKKEEVAEVEGEVEEGEEGEQTEKAGRKVLIQRYKGLGEMNAEELWETTMDPSKRVLKQVTVDDAVEADKIFDVLMGTDVPSRKSFIQFNANKANIDI